MLKTKLVLASKSPRRKKLLEQIGLDFTVHVSPVDERVSRTVDPSETVQRLATEKAEAVAVHYPESITLGADTIVVLDGEILGKPEGPAEAFEMLRRLSGKTHTVFTGIALIHEQSNRRVSAFEATYVTFADLDDYEIAWYVATGSPMDKAGAYGIQDDRGALFISRIEGDYYNVVGLPLHRMYRILQEDFNDLLINQPYLPLR